MALDPTTLAATLQPLLKTAHLTVGAADNPALNTFCSNLASAIASAVVGHIVASAEVIPGTLVSPPGTTGGAILGIGKVT